MFKYTFALALLATAAFAEEEADTAWEDQEWEDDNYVTFNQPTGLEDAAKEITSSLDFAADLIDEALEEAANEAIREMDDLPRDVAEALEDFNRDVECFWAEQEEGRTCEKWELWAAEEECWQSGM